MSVFVTSLCINPLSASGNPMCHRLKHLKSKISSYSRRMYFYFHVFILETEFVLLGIETEFLCVI